MASLTNYIEAQIEESINTKIQLLNNGKIIKAIEDISNIIIHALEKGNKVIFAGNGGSAADAQHLAGELVSRFYYDRPGLYGLALTTDTSILTAIGNDYGYENIFSRQIEAIGQKGDILIGISTSGNSLNIVKAIKTAKTQELVTVGFAGITEGEITQLCDYIVAVPSSSTPRIQEAHILIGHIICAIVEKTLFPKGNP